MARCEVKDKTSFKLIELSERNVMTDDYGGRSLCDYGAHHWVYSHYMWVAAKRYNIKVKTGARNKKVKITLQSI